MLKDIVRPERKLEITYGLRFFIDAGGGCEFPCDADGNVKLNQMTEVAIENYKDCLAHPEEYPYAYNEVHEYRRWIKDSTGVLASVRSVGSGTICLGKNSCRLMSGKKSTLINN